MFPLLSQKQLELGKTFGYHKFPKFLHESKRDKGGKEKEYHFQELLYRYKSF